MNRATLIAAAPLFVLVPISLFAGRVWLSPGLLLSGADPLGHHLAILILLQLRLPRSVLALAIGAALGLSGAALQGLTRNPLAEPGLLGVSTGAAFGAVLAFYFGLAALLPLATPVLGMAGACAAALLTLRLGRGGGSIALVLAGAAVSALAAALLALALNLAPNPYAAYEITSWLLGSLADRSWVDVALALPFIALGMSLLLGSGPGLDALTLGETQARSLGVDTGRLTLLVVAGTTLAVGAATAVSGAIGFIGLVAPHLVRPLVFYQPRKVLVPAALLGASLLLAADIAVRLIHLNPELKLGVLTSLLGTPFFFYLVTRLRRRAS